MLEGFVLAPGRLLCPPCAKRPGALLRHPPAPLQLLAEEFWHLSPLVELSQRQAPPPRDLRMLNISFSAVPTTDLFGVFLLPTSGEVQEKKKSLSRDIICAPALFQSKSKGFGLISSLLRQKINN